MNWERVVFLHTGWADQYDGTEAPEGGHAYLQNAVGVEAENFKPVDGWCYGYAPVARTGESRGLKPIPIAGRTLNISKLGAPAKRDEIDGITIVWTAKKPGHGPVIVGLYDNATVYRYMPPYSGDERVFIAKARAEDCRVLPRAQRTVAVIQKQKGFPGMAAAWFPGEHRAGPAREFLAQVAEYLPIIRRCDSVRPIPTVGTDEAGGNIPALTNAESRYCDEILEKDRRLRAYLHGKTLSEATDAASWLAYLNDIKSILGNVNNDLAFVATLLIKQYLERRFGIVDFDAARKPQGAAGEDVVAVTSDGRRIVGELKTTKPYQPGFGAQQRSTILKDLARLAASDADHRIMFLIDPDAFSALCRPIFASRAGGVEIVDLVSERTFLCPRAA